MDYQRKQKWKAFLLMLLLLNQMAISMGNTIKFYHPRFQKEVSYDFNDLKSNDLLRLLDKEYEVSSSQKDQCPVKHHRQKRAIAAILFAASIIASLVNIGFDIYLQIKKCEGIYPSIRTNVDKFERIRKNLVQRAKEMNIHYTISKNLMEYTSAANIANMGILNHIDRIMTVTTGIIESLSPLSVIAFYKKSVEIQKEIKKHNSTVAKWKLVQIETEYRGIFSNWKSILIGVGPVVGTLGALSITKLFKWYKLQKLTSTLSAQRTTAQLSASLKAQKIFGVTNVKQSITSTVVAQQKSLQAASKISKFVKVAGVLTSVISIGMEAYSFYRKVKACEKQRSNSEKALKKIKPEQTKFKNTEKKLIKFRQDLLQAYKKVKDQITSKRFFDYINIIKNIASNADKPTKKIKQAGINMANFVKKIEAANYKEVPKLQALLDSALSSMQYTMECLEKKIKTLTYTYKHCKEGRGTMKFIFDLAVKQYNTNSFKCTSETGQPYTKFPETNRYISSRMIAEKLQADCVLNSKEMRKLACQYYVQEFKNPEIEEKTGLTAPQVNYFVSNCPPAEITPAIKERLCILAPYMNYHSLKNMYLKYDQNALLRSYKKCPIPAAIPIPVKAIICTRKQTGKSKASILQYFNQYHGTKVTAVYNSCSNAIQIPGDIKANICERRKSGASLSAVISFYNDYVKSKVTEVYNTCAP